MNDGGNHFQNDEDYQQKWMSMLVYALLHVEQCKLPHNRRRFVSMSLSELLEHSKTVAKVYVSLAKER